MVTKIRMGMVGGGQGAFIGAVHRMAAALDGQIELVCGAFSSTAERSISAGQSLFLPSERCYPDYDTMFAEEAKLPASERMQFVAIVTPNHLHFPIAKRAFESGFHVLSDKPATIDFDEAVALKQEINKHQKLYALSHTYTGYPLVKQAKYMVESGVLGKVVKVVVEYTQGWLASKDDEGSKQASWRLDPSRAGKSCCMGDIGVHAANLAEYVSCLNITELCADIAPTVEGRQLDDDGTVMLRFANGARGALLASQIQVGDENNLRLRVIGEKRALEWSQLEPNTLWLKSQNEPAQMIRTGVGEFGLHAQQAVRTPAGHPEGYLEAFANIYQNFCRQIRAYEAGEPSTNTQFDVPGINDALRGMAFIDSVVAASASSEKWHPLDLRSVHRPITVESK